MLYPDLFKKLMPSPRLFSWSWERVKAEHSWWFGAVGVLIWWVLMGLSYWLIPA